MTTGTIRPKDDQNVWNFIFSVLFALLLAFSVWDIYRLYGGLPFTIPLFDFFLIALAIFRIVRLFTYDKITRFLREFFMRSRTVERDGGVFIERTPYRTGPFRTIHDLLECPWCTGVWASLVVVYAYFAFSFAWYVILMLAVAGVGSFFQVFSNMLGWRAENLKIDARDKGAQ